MSTANEVKHSQAALEEAIAEQAEILSALVNDYIYEDVSLSCLGFVQMKDTPQDCQDQFDRMEDRGNVKLDLVAGAYIQSERRLRGDYSL